jgi:hypothetical protein
MPSLLCCAARTSWLAVSACLRACAIRPRLASPVVQAQAALLRLSTVTKRHASFTIRRGGPATLAARDEREYNFVARPTEDGTVQITLYHGGRGEEQDRAEIRSV